MGLLDNFINEINNDDITLEDMLFKDTCKELGHSIQRLISYYFLKCVENSIKFNANFINKINYMDSVVRHLSLYEYVTFSKDVIVGMLDSDDIKSSYGVFFKIQNILEFMAVPFVKIPKDIKCTSFEKLKEVSKGLNELFSNNALEYFIMNQKKIIMDPRTYLSCLRRDKHISENSFGYKYFEYMLGKDRTTETFINNVLSKYTQFSTYRIFKMFRDDGTLKNLHTDHPTDIEWSNKIDDILSICISDTLNGYNVNSDDLEFMLRVIGKFNKHKFLNKNISNVARFYINSAPHRVDGIMTPCANCVLNIMVPYTNILRDNKELIPEDEPIEITNIRERIHVFLNK